MTVLVGTSGWQYRHWRYTYFRKGVPQNKWFEQVLRDFRTVELNVTFYRLPREEVFAGWYTRSPDDAVITVKASSMRARSGMERAPARWTGPAGMWGQVVCLRRTCVPASSFVA